MIMHNIAEILLLKKNIQRLTTILVIYFHLHLSIVNAKDTTNEILTLQKQNNVKCITEDMTSPVYILPPITEDVHYDSSLVVSEFWTDDDWVLDNKNNSVAGIVTDKRWEDFQTIFTKYQRFSNKISVSLSIYTTENIEFYISDEDSISYKSVEKNNSPKWKHFNILLNNEHVFLLENGTIIHIIENFLPTQFVIKTMNETYWKIHEYSYKRANTPTTGKLTKLTVPATSKKECLMFYVSLCEECFLYISSNNNFLHIKHVKGEPSTIDKSWQLHMINITQNVETIFTLYRGINKFDNELGEWLIDVRWCPDIVNNNKVIYEIHPLIDQVQQNRECHLLEEEAGELKNNISRNFGKKKTFNCRPGMLGKKCNISCEALLGSEYKYCQKHRICENSECKCAWGYDGTYCEKGCRYGYWGLSCENKCHSTWTECHPIFGDYSKNRPRDADVSLESLYEHKMNKLHLTVIFLVVVSVILIVIFYFWKN